jgi:ethanolamine ammonia-lyase small subunit
MSTPANPEDPWARLRQFTRARIAIGRTGHAQKTASILAFGLAHAQARDAVHLALDVAALETALRDAGLDALHVLQAHGAAADRDQYLRRPTWAEVSMPRAARDSFHRRSHTMSSS